MNKSDLFQEMWPRTVNTTYLSHLAHHYPPGLPHSGQGWFLLHLLLYTHLLAPLLSSLHPSHSSLVTRTPATRCSHILQTSGATRGVTRGVTRWITRGVELLGCGSWTLGLLPGLVLGLVTTLSR